MTNASGDSDLCRCDCLFSMDSKLLQYSIKDGSFNFSGSFFLKIYLTLSTK